MEDVNKEGVIVANERKYYNITNRAKFFVNEKNSAYTIQAWMRSNNTVQYFKIWEEQNNPNFNNEGYEKLLKELKEQNSILTPKRWIEATSAIGIISKQGKSGGTYVVLEFSFDFYYYVSPHFRYNLIALYDLNKQVEKFKK